MNVADAQLKAERQLEAARAALRLLMEARDLLVRSDNRKTLARVRSAISSAKGAVRICTYRTVRGFYADRRNSGEIE